MRHDSSTHARSLMKGLSWESFAFVVTLLIAYIMLGDVRVSLKLTIVAQGIKTVFFYIHERIWHQISWGKRERNC